MGNDNSNDLIYRDNSLLSFGDDLSDYNGIISTEESFESDEEIIEEITELKSYNLNKIPVTFEWESGGNSVYLSGSFCNWNQFFLMEKTSNGKHTLVLNLNKGFIQYKFKVDNEWKYNNKYPTIVDNGNINNYIDTTNWEITVEQSEETTNSKSELSFLPNENIELKNFQNNDYSNYFPKKKEMNENNQKVPEEYKKNNLDKKMRQSKIGNNNYFSPEEDNILGENYSNKKIKYISSEQINHINYKIKNNKNKTNNPIVSSIILRHRLKFTTFVYYKNE